MIHARRSVISTLVCLLLAALTLTVGTAPASAAEDFYTPPTVLPAGDPGTVLRVENTTVVATPLARSRKVMYLSEDTHGDPIAVTGTVIVPMLPWFGPGKRPIIGYAVGTHGLGDQCAPSKLLSTGLDYEQLTIASLVQRGYAVAVTDYEGLGTPGVHTYANRASQAQAVLNSVRAAQNLAGIPDGGPVGLMGYSQGGGAAAAAAEVAAGYAPELDVRGVAAGAPPADLKAVGASLDGSLGTAFLGYAILGLESAYPDQVDLASLLNAAGQRVAEEIVDQCVWESLPRYAFTRTATLTKDGRSVVEYMEEAPFDGLLEEQRLGTRTPQVPTYVAHSALDDIVPYGQGREMARAWCAAGAQVNFQTLVTPTHVGGYAEFGVGATRWLDDVLRGQPAGSNCGSF